MATTEMNCLASGGGVQTEINTTGIAVGGYVDISISGTPQSIMVISNCNNGYKVSLSWSADFDDGSKVVYSAWSSNANNANYVAFSNVFQLTTGNLRIYDASGIGTLNFVAVITY